jgi:hypothetical protein
MIPAIRVFHLTCKLSERPVQFAAFPNAETDVQTPKTLSRKGYLHLAKGPPPKSGGPYRQGQVSNPLANSTSVLMDALKL